MRKAILLICMLQLVVAGSVWAQATTGSIVGSVNDPSKATVVGAEVVARNQETGVSYKGKTDGSGDYVLHNLPPGVYTVTVSNPGFETAEARDVKLDIDQKQLLNFELKLGQVTTVTTVSSTPTMLQTQTSELGTVIETADILDLPLNGRNFFDLATLVPGVVQVGGSINTFSLSVNGQREYANSIQIDGIETTTNRTQDITVIPSVDSVQEFKVSTSSYDAEFGRAAGGVISIQTKAGTNGFHGAAYEFYRPDNFAARTYSFGPTSTPSNIRQHQYGGTLGGPIKRNKVFFFVSYEGLIHNDLFTELASTPPIQMITVLPSGAVDLSRLVDPFTGKQDPIFDPNVSIACGGSCSQQFAGNIIPADRVSKAGLNTLLNFFPKPNLAGVHNGFFQNFQVHSPVNNTGRTGDSRFDWSLSDKDRLFVSYHYQDTDQLTTDPYHGATVVPGAGDADQANQEDTRAQTLSVTETHTIGTRALNEVRFGFARLNENLFSLLNGRDLSDQFGVGNVTVPGFPDTVAYPFIDLVSGYLAGGSTFKPFRELDNNIQISDNFTLSQVGKHDFKFGGDFRRLNSHPDFSLFPTGFQFYGFPFANLTGDATFKTFDANSFWGNGGSDIADLLLGLPLDVDIGLQLTKPHTQSWELHFYGQDTYRITSKLTLNYGLRYEYQNPFTEANNDISNFDPVSGNILLAGRGGNSRSLVNARKNDFGPRAGIAYQLNSKTVVRVGAGVYYSPENDGREDFLTKNAPFADQNVFKNNNTAPIQYQLDAGVPRVSTIQIPSGASSINPATLTNGALETTFSINPNIKTGYSELFNVAVQRQLGASFTAEVAYVGSRSHRLAYEIGNINANNVLTPNLGVVEFLDDAGFGNYNSMQVKVTKRASRNLSFLASYTYGHNIDNGPAPFDLGHINNDFPQNPQNLNAEIASADTDIRHNFVFSGLYRLPIGKGQRFLGDWGRAEEVLLGGWQINSILSMHTGSPINVVRGSGDPAFPGLRPDILKSPVLPKGQRTLGQYFNTTVCTVNPCSVTAPDAAFSVARFNCNAPNAAANCDPNAPGDAGRNLFNGPGFVNLDFSLFKEFAPSDRLKVQTRLELFNALNTPHFGNPNGDISSGSLGAIQFLNGDGRRVQIAVKIIF
jgi:Carboxypeptidase regulatory-like domain